MRQWLRSITLPVIALSVGGIAGFSKYTREAMLDVLASEHVRMAWADGIPSAFDLFPVRAEERRRCGC